MQQLRAAVTVTDLEKTYGNVKVLERISLTVRRGSIFALLGANGAGKTTMIRILSTLLKPDYGQASVCGFDVVRQAERVRREISLTGQHAAVDDILTGRENLRLIGKLRHLSDVHGKVEELLERFQLLDAADRRVATYSGGMRRRLDLAMSLLGSPSVIFLDEPTTGLDPQSRTAVWKLVKDLARSGTTVFLTTQYLEEADQLADRIAILDRGRIVAEGTAAELKKKLPSGHIELRFLDEEEIERVARVLDGYSATPDYENLTLALVTDGSVNQTTDVLKRLENAGVHVAGFSQKLPTLEDVYLAIVGETRKEEGAR